MIIAEDLDKLPAFQSSDYKVWQILSGANSGVECRQGFFTYAPHGDAHSAPIYRWRVEYHHFDKTRKYFLDLYNDIRYEEWTNLPSENWDNMNQDDLVPSFISAVDHFVQPLFKFDLVDLYMLKLGYSL